MKKYILIVIVFSGLFIGSAKSQQTFLNPLIKAGFKNIRILEEDSVLYIALENDAYRWDVKGIVVALDSLLPETNHSATVQLVLLNMGVPQLLISTSVADWQLFRSGGLSAGEYKERLHVSSNPHEVWGKLSKIKKYESSFGDIDLVLYTQLKLKNMYYDRMFDTQINFAPTIDLKLWKGARATIQMLFPLTNATRSFGEDGKFIRPGFATLSQGFLVLPKLYATMSIGLFNKARSGINLESDYRINEHITFEGDLAYTGYVNTRLYDIGGDDWGFQTWDKLTWSVGGSYYNYQLDAQAKVSVQRFLLGDTGIRADLTRMFGEVAVGLYAMYSDGEKDAGFNVTIPLPGSKRTRHGIFRVTLPKYFDWEYSASNTKGKGSSFEVRPNENRIEYLFNPVYIKSQLLNY